ncbi:50S ribosomal protein L3 [Candidatus Micrarchaeota archaeon]|nr:50S ribosomal protein L3 [Candidatus Micrarchaeota archaeon]
MTDIWKPRKGSRAFRPRKRAKSQLPSIQYWGEHSDSRILGFVGYKAGMTHIAYLEDLEGPSKGQEVVTPVTVLEIPKVYAYGIRFYKDKHSCADFFTEDSNLLSKLSLKKRPKSSIPGEFDDLSLLIFIDPSTTSIGKKHIERMEIGIGGDDPKQKLEYAKPLVGKELSPPEVLKHGEFWDIIAVTKGKGWQGPVKRFGVGLQRYKATGQRRHVGTLGAWTPGYVLYTVPQAGQTGYQTRTEFNKRIMKVGDNAEEINPKGGFPHYGFVRTNYVLIKGSVPGPVKRLIRMRLGVRAPPSVKEPKLTYVSLESKV